MTFRVCVKETQIQGVTIKPGDKVAMSTTLAARDPDEWDRPNEIILNRKPRHVSFGYGPHLCVGMHLAKREMRIAMKEFLTVIPEFRLTPGVEMRTALHGVIQPDKLMLERSEEHTSELQSLMRISYAVFCLKKQNSKSK